MANKSIDDLDFCPCCGVSFVGMEIPKNVRHLYGINDTHYKRQIGITVVDRYDGVWDWQCPDCKATWPSENHIRRGNG